MPKQGRKDKVNDMLYKYREAFSLRDKIGTCPNIKVEIDVTDKSPFFIRPYYVREEDKAFIDVTQWIGLTTAPGTLGIYQPLNWAWLAGAYK